MVVFTILTIVLSLRSGLIGPLGVDLEASPYCLRVVVAFLTKALFFFLIPFLQRKMDVSKINRRFGVEEKFKTYVDWKRHVID